MSKILVAIFCIIMLTSVALAEELYMSDPNLIHAFPLNEVHMSEEGITFSWEHWGSGSVDYYEVYAYYIDPFEVIVKENIGTNTDYTLNYDRKRTISLEVNYVEAGSTKSDVAIELPLVSNNFLSDEFLENISPNSCESHKLAKPNVSISLNNTTLTATWDEVKGASSYACFLRNQTDNKFVRCDHEVYDNTYTFDVEPGKEYRLSIASLASWDTGASCKYGNNWYTRTFVADNNTLSEAEETVNTDIVNPIETEPVFNHLSKGNKENNKAKVTELQEQLILLGYDLGKWGADGDFGGATETAVKNFQMQYGLDATGVVDNDTWLAIMNVNPSESSIEVTEEMPESTSEETSGSFCLHANLEVYEDYDYDSIGSFQAIDNTYHSFTEYISERYIYCNDCNTIVETTSINETVIKQAYHYFYPDRNGNMACMECGYEWECPHSNAYVINNQNEDEYTYFNSEKHVYSSWIYAEMYPEEGTTYYFCPDCGEFAEKYSSGSFGWGISDLPMNQTQKTSIIEAHTFANGVCDGCGYKSEEPNANDNQSIKPESTVVPEATVEVYSCGHDYAFDHLNVGESFYTYEWSGNGNTHYTTTFEVTKECDYCYICKMAIITGSAGREYVSPSGVMSQKDRAIEACDLVNNEGGEHCYNCFHYTEDNTREDRPTVMITSPTSNAPISPNEALKVTWEGTLLGYEGEGNYTDYEYVFCHVVVAEEGEEMGMGTSFAVYSAKQYYEIPAATFEAGKNYVIYITYGNQSNYHDMIGAQVTVKAEGTVIVCDHSAGNYNDVKDETRAPAYTFNYQTHTPTYFCNRYCVDCGDLIQDNNIWFVGEETEHDFSSDDICVCGFNKKDEYVWEKQEVMDYSIDFIERSANGKDSIYDQFFTDELRKEIKTLSEGLAATSYELIDGDPTAVLPTTQANYYVDTLMKQSANINSDDKTISISPADFEMICNVLGWEDAWVDQINVMVEQWSNARWTNKYGVMILDEDEWKEEMNKYQLKNPEWLSGLEEGIDYVGFLWECLYDYHIYSAALEGESAPMINSALSHMQNSDLFAAELAGGFIEDCETVEGRIAYIVARNVNLDDKLREVVIDSVLSNPTLKFSFESSTLLNDVMFGTTDLLEANHGTYWSMQMVEELHNELDDCIDRYHNNPSEANYNDCLGTYSLYTTYLISAYNGVLESIEIYSGSLAANMIGDGLTANEKALVEQWKLFMEWYADDIEYALKDNSIDAIMKQLEEMY